MIKKYTSICIYLGAWFGLSPLHLYAKPKNNIPDSLQVLRIQVGELAFDMQKVEGGLFIMGGTPEQHNEVISTDLPTHTVSLHTYYIGTTEVTQDLWQAIMPEWYISDEWNIPNQPITDVNWYDCQEFIRRLNNITGLPFRLPTEAEWEFAARGGNVSRGYRFAGGNKIEDVSWGLSNAGFRKHNVGERKPNELGLYDMTGNVSEWCSDWYGMYHLGTDPNPQGATEGELKVVRGGSFDNCKDNSYLSRREYYNPNEAMNYCGFRLALTLPNEQSKQVAKEPTITKKLKINNLRVRFRLVAGETPFYISEEPINQRVWQKVNGLPLDEAWSKVVVDKTNNEWNEFLERCRRMSGGEVCFAKEAEVNQAIMMGVTLEPNLNAKRQKRWEKDTRSIQRHRRRAEKAQKWADLVGVKIKTIDDPTLQIYTNQDKDPNPRWLVIR